MPGDGDPPNGAARPVSRPRDVGPTLPCTQSSRPPLKMRRFRPVQPNDPHRRLRSNDIHRTASVTGGSRSGDRDLLQVCLETFFDVYEPFRARNVAPMVNLEVAKPVGPTYSTPTKPTFSSSRIRSRTGIAPPTHSDHASRLLATSGGRSSFNTISANWRRPLGFRTR